MPSDWHESWTVDNGFIQLAGGIGADRGMDSESRSVSIRGTQGTLGQVTPRDRELLAIDWFEDTECGEKQYALMSVSIAEEELLQIAKSLEDEK